MGVKREKFPTAPMPDDVERKPMTTADERAEKDQKLILDFLGQLKAGNLKILTPEEERVSRQKIRQAFDKFPQKPEP